MTLSSEELLELTKIEGELPTDRLSLRKWIKRSCVVSLKQAEEERDQVGFVVSHQLFLDCADLDSRAEPVHAVALVLGCCSVDDFQVSMLPKLGDVMVNTWPQSPVGWDGFQLPQ